MDITAGSVLAGKYRVERTIGKGGMGMVVEARHTTLDERVALKFLLPDLAAVPEASERFLREARAAVKIKSAHVARVSDVGTLESGAPYMVMEYLEGRDASEVLEGGRVLPVSEAVDYVVQACDAISEAHAAGIIHRDLKPANLFVTQHSDGTPLVKVLDFGISKITGEGAPDGLTRTTATMGSALYMSPEQIRQSKSVDLRTDIYALGVTLYELLTGRQPFMGESFAALCVEIATGTPTPLLAVRPDVPPELATVVEKAYARELEQRYQSVAELVVALAPWAPPRSQPIIERIARAAGLVAGRAAAPALSLGGTGAPVANQIPTGSYGAPAQTAPSGTNLTGVATAAPRTRPSAIPLFVAAGGLLLLGLGGATIWALARATHEASTESAASAAPETSPASAPAVPGTAEAAPAVEPATTAPGASAASPSEPATSASAAVGALGGEGKPGAVAAARKPPRRPRAPHRKVPAKPPAKTATPTPKATAYDPSATR